MATKNASFRNFGAFSKLMNNAANTDAAFDSNNLALTLNAEHTDFIAAKTAYDLWASNTMLADAVSPLTNIRFADLFAVADDGMGHPVVVFNPAGTNGSSWSKNESGLVNALLTAFGTLRYGDLRHGLHDRKFDKSLVIEHNVRSAFDAVNGKWIRFDWNNRRFTQNTPWIERPEGKSWLSKHVEIDRMILAIVGGQQIKYTFFQEIAYQRFERNILANMTSLVSKVNEQLSNQAEVANVIRKTENAEKRGDAPVASGSIVVDGTDLKTLGGIVKVAVTMSYDKNPVIMTVNTENPKDLALIASTMQSKKFVGIKIA